MRTSNLPGKLHRRAHDAFLCIALVAASPAAAQKKGGTLRLYHNDNPPSTSLLEESTIASVTPFAAVFNNLVMFDPAKVAREHRDRHSRSRRKLGVGFHQHQTDVQAAAGREMARRPAVHRQGRAVHLADADRQGRDAGLQAQSAQGLVHQAAGRQHQRRLRGDLRTERAAAEPAGAARQRVLGGLSLPCAAAGDAHQAGRHRAVQIRRVQARRLRSASCAIPITSRRTGPISTRSRCARSTAAPRGCWRSRPAITTSPFPPTSAFP